MSSAVEKVWLFLVGIVVLRSISRVNTPPRVSMPSDSGVTSRRRTSLTSPFKTPAWIAAPMATTSSGLTLRWCYNTGDDAGCEIGEPEGKVA